MTRQSGLKSLVRNIGRKNNDGIARQVMKHTTLRKKVLEIMIQDIHKELKVLCARKTSSLFRDHSLQAMMNFSWDSLVAEIEILYTYSSLNFEGNSRSET